jgi:competence protein ComEC
MLANHKGEIPFLILLLPFLLGIALGFNFAETRYLFTLWILFGISCVAFIVLNLGYRRFQVFRSAWTGGILINALLFFAGWLAVIQNNELTDSHHFSRFSAKFLTVKIVSEPTLKNGIVRFVTNVEQIAVKQTQTTATGALLVSIKDTAARRLRYGDELIVPANYTAVEPPYNPAEFNYKKYLANQNIHYQEFLFPGQYHVVGHNLGNKVIAYSLTLRKRFVEKFKQHMHDTSAIAVASTLILGYKADLSSDVLQAYSKTGTIHVLSVSGAHVAIIYLLINFLLGFLNRFKHGKLIKAVLIIGLIWYYSLLTGFSPAVCRAAVMISMVIIGKTFNRYINTLNILAISAFALLLYNPLFIVDVGFQLSYLAVAGLIIFQPIAYKWLEIKTKWLDKLWQLCSVSIAAQVITFPLSAFYFHQFPVYFLISNLFIIIPTEVIMFAGIGYLLLPEIPMVSSGLGWILEKSILLMNKVLTLIEFTPYSGISKIWLSVSEYLLLFGIIVLLFCFWHYRNKRLLYPAAVLLILFCVSISIKSVTHYQSNSISFLNLRRHYGMIFKSGNEAVVLSDLAPKDKNYTYSIQPGLDSMQVGHVFYCDIRHDTNTAFFSKKANLIQFKNQRILIFDRRIKPQPILQKLKIDYVYLSGNPHVNLSGINRNVDYQKLIIGADNSDRFTKSIIAQADTSHTNYQLLRRNNSISIISN